MKNQNKEKLLKKWAKDENLSLTDMYYKASDEGWTENVVTDQETLRDYICYSIKENNFIGSVLVKIEEDTAAELFTFDYTCGNCCTPEPIYTKEELLEILL